MFHFHWLAVLSKRHHILREYVIDNLAMLYHSLTILPSQV